MSIKYITRMEQKIYITLKGFDSEVVEQAVKDIVRIVQQTHVKMHGPIAMPTRIEKFCLLASPHGDKKAREQFEKRTYKRILHILEPNQQTIDSLIRLNLSPGVHIELKA